MNGFGSGAHSAFLPAAGEKRRKLDAASYVKRADTFRRVKFMTGNAEQIDPGIF